MPACVFLVEGLPDYITPGKDRDKGTSRAGNKENQSLTHQTTFTASFWVALMVRLRSSPVIFSNSWSLAPTPQRTSLLFFRPPSFLFSVSTMPMACDERYCTFSKSSTI